MALLDHTQAAPDDDDTDADSKNPNSKAAKKKHRDSLLLIGIAVVGVILTYLIYRSNKNAQANASTTSTSAGTTPAGLLAGGSGTTNATDPYAEAGVNQLTSQFQQQGTALQGLQTALSNLQSEVGSMQASPSTPTGSTSPAPAATPGYGYINLPGIGQSVILGDLTQGGYTGYNVGGGAPVYFGNANSVSQGSGQETAGSFAYTPVAYAPLVGSTASSGGPLPGQH